MTVVLRIRTKEVLVKWDKAVEEVKGSTDRTGRIVVRTKGVLINRDKATTKINDKGTTIKTGIKIDKDNTRIGIRTDKTDRDQEEEGIITKLQFITICVIFNPAQLRLGLDVIVFEVSIYFRKFKSKNY